MTLVSIENNLNTFLFLSLFVTTLIYWGQIAINMSSVRYLNGITTALMVFAHLGLTILLVLRWINSSHFPLSNLYESALFLAWTFTLLHLLLDTKLKGNWLGNLTAPGSTWMHAFATLGLPMDMQRSSALVPSLQSNWLIMHVTTMMFSYGALLAGCLLAMAFLILNQDVRSMVSVFNIPDSSYLPYNYKSDMARKITYPLSFPVFFQIHRMRLASQLDYWSYRTIGFGFAFLTIGILSGAVWANEAWGAYWSWDPKETWALITWLSFAIYLHLRISRKWCGKGPALVAFLGFINVWFCYLGVNLLGQGLHSYGWFR